ncbi:hypothetical protein [Paenirhodobacter sp.]|uniref:hypothetical protein n=1 Tax=Paenirhodobacter sp. TaxID=1965326 RepID=UPI003B40B399
MQIELPSGLLFSRTGSYGTVAHSLLNGALLACREANETSGIGVRLLPQIRDPYEILDNYATAIQPFLDQDTHYSSTATTSVTTSKSSTGCSWRSASA